MGVVCEKEARLAWPWRPVPIIGIPGSLQPSTTQDTSLSTGSFFQAEKNKP